MRRPFGDQRAGAKGRIGVLLAGALLAMAASAPAARAAMVTDIAENPDPDRQYAIDLNLSWQYTQEDATITRQQGASNFTADELAYKRSTNTMDLVARFALFKGFELHVDVPYVIEDVQNWQYATVDGKSVEATSSIQNNTASANYNGGLSSQTALFSVPGTVYRGGFSDPTFGFTARLWDDRHPTELPETAYPPVRRFATWVLGFDYTPPIAPVMNPSDTNPGTPNSSSYLPVGTGMHQLNFWTAISKRLGVIEPFIKIHYDLQLAGSNAYNNCSITAADNPQYLYMSSEQATECSNEPGVTDTSWNGQTGLQPPMIGGVLMGTDFHLVNTGRNGQSLDMSINFNADYISKGRTYSELSDELHKLTYVDDYFDLGGKFTADFRFAGIVHWLSFVSLSTFTPHLLTTESVGNPCPGLPSTSTCSNSTVQLNTNQVNPDYSFAVDQPGRQFGITSVLIVSASTSLRVDF